METYWLDWLNLLLRWLHVVAVIAWVGSSFYFVFLDKNLLPPTDPELKQKGVDGAMWAVHGGGFYNPQKYLLAPQKIDSKLHWFYWESYTTWLSGFALFCLLYLYHADVFLLGNNSVDWSAPVAGAVALAFLLIFWLAYDCICRVFGFHKRLEWLVPVSISVLLVLASFLATHWFPGRAAFLLVGAMIATSMSANVLFWIIPGQKKALAQMQAGEPVNPIYGLRGKQRSVHNTYFALPVLLTMLSNHYAFLYSGKHNAWVLLALLAAGALIRQFFVQRHDWHNGRASHPWPFALLGVACLVGVMWLLLPATANNSANTQSEAETNTPSYAVVQPILAQHCYSCHGAQVQMKNLRLDTPEQVHANAALIYQNVVLSKTMPLSNSTKMTESERALIGRWFTSGAPVQ